MNVLISVFCVALGGSLGALFRFALSSEFDKNKFNYPFGTFLANMAASFLLGLLIAISSAYKTGAVFDLFFETGFCATLSTFSSLAFQIANMLRDKRFLIAIVYATTTFMFGMALFLTADQLF